MLNPAVRSVDHIVSKSLSHTHLPDTAGSLAALTMKLNCWQLVGRGLGCCSMYSTAPTTKDYPSPNPSSAEVKKPWSRIFSHNARNIFRSAVTKGGRQGKKLKLTEHLQCARHSTCH